MAIPERPLTRIEQYWDAIYNKLDGGGGGNPNYVETIEGTLANPWGELVFSELAADLHSGSVSVFVTSPMMDGLLLPLRSTDGQIVDGSIASYAPTGGEVSLDFAMSVGYAQSGAIDHLYTGTGNDVQDATQMAGFVQSVATVIHHPLPEGGD